MEKLVFIKDYINDDNYRRSFADLAKRTFDVDYETWYKLGLWGNEARYINYSYCAGENIVANISVNEFELMVNGTVKRAIQIGTVMTEKEYRNRGLSRKLMYKIFDDYKDKVDFYYLFANESVREFYPKFGFERTMQNSYEVAAKDIKLKKGNLRKLHIKEDKNLINDCIKNRVPVSRVLSAFNDKWPLKTYCFRLFNNDLYYLSEEDCIVVFDRDGEGNFNLYDVISNHEFNLDNILEKIVNESDVSIKIGFVPEFSRYKVSEGKVDPEDDGLYIKGIEKTEKYKWLFPITSHT